MNSESMDLMEKVIIEIRWNFKSYPKTVPPYSVLYSAVQYINTTQKSPIFDQRGW